MRYLNLSLIVLFTALISACTKPASNGVANNATTNVSNTNNFIINGVKDISVPANGSITLPLEITFIEGTQENVTLSISGLPENATGKFSAPSGTPSFSSSLEIAGNNATQGTYPLVIKAATTTGKVKIYNFNLTIKEATDCAAILAGTYTENSGCSGISATTMKIKADPNNKKIIYISDYGQDIPLEVDCTNNTIKIDHANTSGTNSFFFKGSGTFELPNKISFNMNTIVHYGHNPNGATDRDCNYVLTR